MLVLKSALKKSMRFYFQSIKVARRQVLQRMKHLSHNRTTMNSALIASQLAGVRAKTKGKHTQVTAH